MKVNDRPQLPSTHHQLWIGNGLEVCDDLSFGGERVGVNERSSGESKNKDRPLQDIN